MNSKKKAGRFDELMDVARTRTQRDKSDKSEISPEIHSSKSTTKSTDPNFTRTTIYLPKDLHRQLKAAAASEDKQMSDIVIELIEGWLNKGKNDREGAKERRMRS